MASTAPVFHGSVSQEGDRLVLAPEEAPQRRAHLRLLKGLAVDITIVKHTRRRSLQANHYYWGNVLQAIEDYTGQPKQDIHDAMCALFLEDERRQVEFFNKLTGECFEIDVTRRSSKLTGDKFFDFVENVRQWAREKLGVETRDPDSEYWRRRE
jgi:hypothetical protein